MRVIHVLRKPLSEGTVASNVVKNGTGGINIDASRISSTGDHMRPFQPTNNDLEVYGVQTGFQPTNHKGGRWPANVILQHLDGCRCETKRVKPSNGSGTAVRHRGVKDSKETVANWICEPGCPVARLDEQSGVTKSTGGRTGNKDGGGIYGGGKGLAGAYSSDDPGFGDTGGASRFYKQVGGKSDG